MSDWFAPRSHLPSARAALDLVMPGPEGPWGDALLEEVRANRVDLATVDEKVIRILRVAARGGALEDAALPPPPSYDYEDVASVLRRTAATSCVLAQNDR